MYTFFVILWSMVCTPLLVRYYALEMTAIVIIISFAVFDDTAWKKKKGYAAKWLSLL